jgi:Icc-related predicted phosphoesterase
MAAPNCFVTRFICNLENEELTDSEQIIPGMLAADLDMADFFIAQIPRPTLLSGGVNDFFDVRGLRETYEELHRLYAILGAEDRVDLYVGPTTHDFHKEARENMYRFFNRHAGVNATPADPDEPLEKDSTLQVTPGEAEKVVDVLMSLGVPVAYIMGNDEEVSLEADNDSIISIHARRVVIGDFDFLGYQYSPPFMGGIFEKPEEEMRKNVLSLEPLMTERTVFVTHSPAQGILDWTAFSGHVGSSSLRTAIQRNPLRAHIHGHIHGSFGRQGKHFNVASAWQYRGMVIDLDDMSHEVVVTS